MIAISDMGMMQLRFYKHISTRECYTTQRGKMRERGEESKEKGRNEGKGGKKRRQREEK